MTPNAASAGVLLLTLIPIFAQPPEEQMRKFDEAERRIVRLSPTAFPELPPNLARELRRS
jgi:hypothetical protein